MKTADILNAIAALDEADDALRNGNVSISEQMVIGNLCRNASYVLRLSLTAEHPECKVKA